MDEILNMIKSRLKYQVKKIEDTIEAGTKSLEIIEQEMTELNKSGDLITEKIAGEANILILKITEQQEILKERVKANTKQQVTIICKNKAYITAKQ